LHGRNARINGSVGQRKGVNGIIAAWPRPLIRP
jgi:hypothetical protein